MMLCCTILHLPVIPCYRTLLKAMQNQGIKFFFNGLSLTRHASAPMLRGLCRKRSLGLDLECVHPGALLYEYSSTCICFYTLYSTRQGGALLYGRLWRGPVRCAVESALLLKPPLCLNNTGTGTAFGGWAQWERGVGGPSGCECYFRYDTYHYVLRLVASRNLTLGKRLCGIFACVD